MADCCTGYPVAIFGAASMIKAQLNDAVAAVRAVPVAKKSILVDTRRAVQDFLVIGDVTPP